MQIEGKNAVREALRSENVRVEKLMLEQGGDWQELERLAARKNIRTAFVRRAELQRISQTGRHQGVVALCPDFEYSMPEDIRAAAAAAGEPLFAIVLDGIEDPHNLGSVLRVADCVGAHGVIISARRGVEVNATVLRTSAGAASHVRVARMNVNDAVRALKADFVQVCCADMDGENLYDADLRGDLAIVVGGEGKGVGALTRKLCDRVLSIPQYGRVNSLNASVACGIVSYEALRQRKSARR